MARARTRLVAICLALVSSTAICAGDDESLPANEAPWRYVLQQQLKADQGCTLNEVLTVQEVPLGDDIGLDGRISCFDGRQFTFSRNGKQSVFKFLVCAPAAC
jgi:hypothetical protein